VPKTILLLSGTSEGPPLARALIAAGFRVRATVTRAEACARLFGSIANVQVSARGFTEASLAEFLSAREADLVLDATHPFAVRITRLAHAVCTRLGVPYVRYERPDWTPPPGTVEVDSFAAAAERLRELGKRVLLTIGAKQLKHFHHLHERLELYARILPGAASSEQAQGAGFPVERLLPLQPPFTREENRALLERLAIDVLVTKASGAAGGVIEKVLAAGDVGVKVVMIRRPATAIAHVDTLEDAVAACRRCLQEQP
jgi:precorrin-6A/cobalt-precorrin-6A reductase